MRKFFIALCFLSTFLIGCNLNETNQTKVDVLIKTSESWNGDPLPKYLDGKPEVTILKIVIPPKTKLAWHQHPEINAGVLLKGELNVISETDTLLLKAGEPIVELVNTWHYGQNTGKESAEIIVFYAGVKGRPITVKKK